MPFNSSVFLAFLLLLPLYGVLRGVGGRKVLLLPTAIPVGSSFYTFQCLAVRAP